MTSSLRPGSLAPSPSPRLPRPSIAPSSACLWPVCGRRAGFGLGRIAAPAPRHDGDLGVVVPARASASASSSSSSSSPDDGADDAPPLTTTTAVEQQQQPPAERRASRSRQAELLDRELAAVRAMALDAEQLRAALRALGEEEEEEGEEDGEQGEDGGQGDTGEEKSSNTTNAAADPTSSPRSAPPPAAVTAALQRRLAARRLRERARVVRLPLRYTSSGKRAASRRYLTVPVDVEGVGFTDFLLDAGVYGAAITPALRDRLGLAPTDGAAVTALASGGATVRQRVRLPDLWIGTARLPPLQATVGPLPSAALPGPQAQQQSQSQQQQQQRPSSSSPPPLPLSPAAAAAARAQRQTATEPPGGLLGVKALRQFDLDFDPRAGALGLHPAGHAAAGLLNVSGLRPVACRFTRAGLVCLPVALGLLGDGNGGSSASSELPPPAVLGILDLSATVSVLNWQAAALLGMRCEAALRERADEEAEEEEEQAKAASGGGGGGSKDANPSSSKQQPRPLDYRGHYGQIVFTDPAPALLERPAPPGGAAAGTGSGSAAAKSPLQPPSVRRRPDGVRSTRLELQEHRAAARLVLGDPRVGGGRVELSPPARVAVAHLKGLAQLGLAEQPAMLVGQDVWAARGRAVLCLKEGLLYLE